MGQIETYCTSSSESTSSCELRIFASISCLLIMRIEFLASSSSSSDLIIRSFNFLVYGKITKSDQLLTVTERWRLDPSESQNMISLPRNETRERQFRVTLFICRTWGACVRRSPGASFRWSQKPSICISTQRLKEKVSPLITHLLATGRRFLLLPFFLLFSS